MDDDDPAGWILTVSIGLTVVLWYIGFFDMLWGLLEVFGIPTPAIVRYVVIILTPMLLFSNGRKAVLENKANEQIALGNDENKDEDEVDDSNDVENSALEKLKIRFAEGEISEEEFEKKKEVLENE